MYLYILLLQKQIIFRKGSNEQNPGQKQVVSLLARVKQNF